MLTRCLQNCLWSIALHASCSLNAGFQRYAYMLFAKLSMVQCAARVAVLAQPVPESEVVFARVIVSILASMARFMFYCNVFAIFSFYMYFLFV